MCPLLEPISAIMAKKWESGSSHTKKNWDTVTRMGGNYTWAGRNKACSPCRSIFMLFQKNFFLFKILSNICKNILSVFQIRNSIKQVDSNLIDPSHSI